MRCVARILASILVFVLAAVVPVQAADLRLFVAASGLGMYSDSPTSWLDGGFGKLPAGSASDGSAETFGTLDFQAGVRVDISEHWTAFTHLIARAESEVAASGDVGVTQLWIEGSRDVAGGRFQVRAGTMFLPTSRENVEELWSSPYMISLSALNSWIAEEVRPTGIDVDYRYELSPSVLVRGGATGFIGNDTAGTLLGWRGWSVGNRLSVWNEELPLPPLTSLPTSFPAQKTGTTPFGRDLDDRVGWSGRVRLDAPRDFVAQWTRYDSRGDRALHGDQYSWRTTFDLIGLGYRPIDSLTLAAEHIRGETGMGFAPRGSVDARFESTYALASWQPGPLRFSTRFDWFETRERDFSAAENNDEEGTALALAIVFVPSPEWSFAVEFDDVDATRASAEDALGTTNLDGRMVELRVRYIGRTD